MTTDPLTYPILSDVLEVISASCEYSDCSLVREKALEVLFRTITAEKAVLIFPDKTTSSASVIIKNVDEKYHSNYHTYYHEFDPLQLMKGMHRDKDLNPLPGVRTYSYDSQESTEYYIDFLKPQKVHHKLVSTLTVEQEIHGRIVWMRSQKSGPYADKEVWLAKTISPYMAHALAYNELRERLRLKGRILDHIENQSSVGIILLDKKYRVIHMNQKAEEIFASLTSSATSDSGRELMLSQLRKNCQGIQARMSGAPSGCVAIPRKCVVSGFNHTRFTATFKALDREQGVGNSLLFMIFIEEIPPPLNVDLQYLAELYHLSQREIDVAHHLFSGLKNAHIADKLFISEITVKKHLQRIFKKVGVKNRTSLINKMLTR